MDMLLQQVATVQGYVPAVPETPEIALDMSMGLTNITNMTIYNADHTVIRLDNVL